MTAFSWPAAGVRHRQWTRLKTAFGGHQNRTAAVPGPERAWIVTTSKCNLNCLHCARSIPAYRAEAEAVADMEDVTFGRFESQVAPSLKTVQFGGTNLGEPMFSRKLEGYIDRLKQSEKLREVKLQTNGTYLLTLARMERLVQQDVRIMVSLEGVTEESYKRIRGVSFGPILNGLRQFKTLRERNPGSKSELLLAFAVRYETLGELVPLVELAADVGASQVTVSHFRPVRESHRYQSLCYHRGEANAAVARAAARAAELGIHFVGPRPFDLPAMEEDGNRPPRQKGPEPRCLHPWKSVSINEQGDVMPCCATNAVMGNLGKDDFQTIWNGKRFRQLRQRVNSSNPPSYCRGCVLRGVNLDAASGQLFTDESFLLGAIGATTSAENTSWIELEHLRRSVMEKARRQILSSPFAKRVVLRLRRLYWNLR